MFNKIIIIVNIFLMTLLLDENLENNMLKPIYEEDHLTEDQEKSELCAKNNTNEDSCQEDDEDIKYKFPDTQIKIDLSGPK